MHAPHRLTASVLLATGIIGGTAAAQTFPPPNPYMGPSGTSTMHANAASSGATSHCGPGSGAVTVAPQT
jgi:hypothetical protein